MLQSVRRHSAIVLTVTIERSGTFLVLTPSSGTYRFLLTGVSLRTSSLRVPSATELLLS